jgi:hypothetical protein
MSKHSENASGSLRLAYSTRWFGRGGSATNPASALGYRIGDVVLRDDGGSLRDAPGKRDDDGRN